MEVEMSNEKKGFNIKPMFKKSLNYVYMGIFLFVGFYSGIMVSDYKNAIKPKPQVKNYYNSPFSNGEISIAVNEMNQLILIERKTGNYKVYSDSIGKSIFNMYVDRIHKNVNDAE